jgi:hypothetical protein
MDKGILVNMDLDMDRDMKTIMNMNMNMNETMRANMMWKIRIDAGVVTDRPRIQGQLVKPTLANEIGSVYPCSHVILWATNKGRQ